MSRLALEQLLVHAPRRYSVAGSGERHHARRGRRRRRDHRRPERPLPDLQRHQDGRSRQPYSSSCARGRGPALPVQRLLDRTSGVRDYSSLPEYHDAVRRQPGHAWDDDEFLAGTAEPGPRNPSPGGAGRTRTRATCCCGACSTSTVGSPLPAAARARGHEGGGAGGRSRGSPSRRRACCSSTESATSSRRQWSGPRRVGHRTLLAAAVSLLFPA